MVAQPEVFALVFVVAGLSLEAVSVVAGLSPEVVVVGAELSPEAVVLVVEPEVSEPGVVFVAVVFVAVVSVADVAEPRASVDIVVAFAVLVPVSVVVAWVYSSGRPKFLAFPNVDHFASSSSSVEAVGEESVHSSTSARTNHGFCSILSNLGPRQNKNLEHCYNNPNPGHNTVSDTSALPTDATTNHCRKRCRHLRQGQRRHTSRGSLPPPAVRQIR